MRIVSWNVNGLEACRRKGFLKFVKASNPDIICCQETKVNDKKFKLIVPGYIQIWNPGNRPGYAGTLVLTRREPVSTSLGMGIEKFDSEGRLIVLEYEDYYVLNVYAPSIHENNSPDRPEYRLEWDAAFREYVSTLTKPVILCGDFNATAAEIDTYPKPDKEPEDLFFVPERRDSLQKLLELGLLDVFRTLYPTKEGAYTWWGPKHKDRRENRGSRLDYFLISEELYPCVQSVRHHVDTLGSDHCPLSLTMRPITTRRNVSEEDLAVRWRSTDWTVMEEELFKKQKELAYAAYMRSWDEVERLQNELVISYAAKMMAVRTIADTNSAAGVDGVKLRTDAQKMQAVLSLRSRGYRPLPNRYMKVIDRGKEIPLHIATARDKAMLCLYAYALDPVAESTADHRSFFSRKGRSMYDAQAYLIQALSGDDAPEVVFRGDVFKFFNNAPFDWLLKNIPMDKTMLRKFLKAGTIKDNELFEETRGISFCSSLSPILGNMLLDGLQTWIYDKLYPKGHTDYTNGGCIRFADDFVITARTKADAARIREIVREFLAIRGLNFNERKTYIATVYEGFDFLSFHYQKKMMN